MSLLQKISKPVKVAGLMGLLGLSMLGCKSKDAPAPPAPTTGTIRIESYCFPDPGTMSLQFNYGDVKTYSGGATYIFSDIPPGPCVVTMYMMQDGGCDHSMGAECHFTVKAGKTYVGGFGGDNSGYNCPGFSCPEER